MAFIIVSAQTGHLYGDLWIVRQAIEGGAAMIRTQNYKYFNNNIGEVKLPFIGLVKDMNYECYITPTEEYIDDIGANGVDIVAIDCTRKNKRRYDLTRYAHDHDIQVVADLESIEDLDGKFEADYYATTLSKKTPDIKFISELQKYTDAPIIAEGGYASRRDVLKAIGAGADYVCIGTWFENIVKNTIRGLNESIVNSL